MIKLEDDQLEAVEKMKNGCILNGGVGSGKSLTGLYYYFKENGGSIIDGEMTMMKDPQDLYIITTAKKRDDREWDKELAHYYLATNPEGSAYENKVVIDSWNNIGKYARVKDAFFIFDEDKVTGYGTWAKTFIHISKNNKWIVLSATAGDKWEDYRAVFIANGFYRNKTEFDALHIEYDRFCTSYPRVKCYHDTGRLMRYRNRILIPMESPVKHQRHDIEIWCKYDRLRYKDVFKNRWDYEKEEPIETAAGLCAAVRKIVNTDISRVNALYEIIKDKRRVIIFYNFDYELEILRQFCTDYNIEYSEWNGHYHHDVPEDHDNNCWAYLVHYNACEGWNCIRTDTIIFYSQNYSYKMLEQARGRIDRRNTPFNDLYYYHLKSHAPIDIAIAKALSDKKKFNETKFVDSIF